MPCRLKKFVKLSKYEDGEKKQKWAKNFKFSKRSPYVSDLSVGLFGHEGSHVLNCYGRVYFFRSFECVCY